MHATGRQKLLGSEDSVGLPSYLCWQAAVVSPCAICSFQPIMWENLLSKWFYCFDPIPPCILLLLTFHSLLLFLVSLVINPSLPLICPPGLLFCGWWALSHAWSFFCHQGLIDEFFLKSHESSDVMFTWQYPASYNFWVQPWRISSISGFQKMNGRQGWTLDIILCVLGLIILHLTFPQEMSSALLTSSHNCRLFSDPAGWKIALCFSSGSAWKYER